MWCIKFLKKKIKSIIYLNYSMYFYVIIETILTCSSLGLVLVQIAKVSV